MKSEILKILREADGYISGQQLCDQFQVSRTAVWKVVNQLKEEGYPIEAVRNKGYFLKELPDIFSKEELESRMHNAWAGCEVHFFPEIDSTNTKAKELGEAGASHGTLVVADRQVAGKGRRGRSWSSPAGENIYMTILLRPKMQPVKAPMLTLVMAYSVALAMQTYDIEVGIKWPNDLVVNGKKVCGILTEMSTEIDFINYVIIGTGINVGTSRFPEEISQTATSLLKETGKEIPRAELTAEVMKQFETLYGQFEQTGDLSFLQDGYNAILVNFDRQVRILEPGRERNGIARGIDRQGELLVEYPDGTVEPVFAGEVSVRGIYGYV